MLNKAFDHIVSLGGFCQTGHHIRRRFPDTKAYPFDWWVTPTVALLDLLNSEFSDLFIPDQMKIVMEDAGPAVMCQRYGLMHYHDFYECKIEGRYIPLSVRAKCAKNLDKYAYLLKRFYTLKGKILFIRSTCGYVQHFSQNRYFDRELLEQVFVSLKKLLPNADIELLLLNDYNGPCSDGIYCDTVNNYDETIWSGSDQGWDEMFDRLGITMNPPPINDETLVS